MTESLQPHHARPVLRPIQATQTTQDNGQSVIALQDRSMLSTHAIGVPSEAIKVLECMDGRATLEEIAARFGIEPNVLAPLVQALDKALLLDGPVYEAFVQKRRDEFDALDRLPVRAAGETSVEEFDGLLEQAANDPAVRETRQKIKDRPITGLVVPHLDYERGGLNYAAGWSIMREAPPPDRVVVLGTNHFGRSTGVVLCHKGYETNLGPVRVDKRLARALADQLGAPIVEHQLDHLNEHSIEMQMPWIRHTLGDVPIVSLLVHDPTLNDGHSYDGQGVSLDAFLKSMNEALDAMGGQTLLIASADLSHIGQEFGDPDPLSDHWLSQVEKSDRDHLNMLQDGSVDQFLNSMTTSGNPTHWCTLGGMIALRRLLPDDACHLIRYEQAVDDPDGGVCCVTSAAMILTTRNRDAQP